jgi:hypothetical protein
MEGDEDGDGCGDHDEEGGEDEDEAKGEDDKSKAYVRNPQSFQISLKGYLNIFLSFGSTF